METENQPRVGIAIMIFKGNKVLLGKRKGSHGAGEYAFPGGHLEYMESFKECVLRELAEECGIEVGEVQFLLLANMKKYTPKHYCHIGVTAEWKSGEPQVLEPEKVERWDWYDLDNLPTPLFAGSQLCVDAYKQGFNYKDADIELV